MTISQVLEQAAKVVERGWTQHRLARSKEGFPVPVNAKQATEFCAYGAILKVTLFETSCRPADSAERFLRELFLASQLGIGMWNDSRHRTGPEVTYWLASAAEYAKVLGK